VLTQPHTLMAALAAVVLAVTGCGVPLQDDPVALQAASTPSPVSPSPGGSSVVRVYLVKDARLVEEVRRADDPSEQSALDLLTDGPTTAEKVVGTTTALAPGEYAVEDSGLATVIDVPVQFTQVAGDLQLLAAAQLVWTVTDRRPRSAVQVTFQGEPIELPTDQGLTIDLVRRSDYRSVAPEDG